MNIPTRISQDTAIIYLNLLSYRNTCGLIGHPAELGKHEWQIVYRIPFHTVQLVG